MGVLLFAGAEEDGWVADGDGTTGSWSTCGELVTLGFASSALRPSSSAVIMPVTVPTATTTEAATTMAPRRAARLRSALRAARRWARRPDTVLVPLRGGGRVPPFWEASGPPTLPSAYDWDPSPMGQLEQFTTSVDAVVSRMRTLDATLPERDGIAVFNRVYLAVTEAVDRRIDGSGFPDARAAITLDARFAERYLAAVDAVADERRPPACWRPLFQFRRHPGVRPLQFALAGINAHIGHDLALAVVDSCRTLNCEPADLEDEFDRVGDLLVSLEERIREDLMPGPDLLQIADPLTHLLGAFSLERARDATWSAARALWALRRLPDVAEEFTERLDAAVGFAGRMLLTPLPD